ncbi:hypothetical protein [Gordonia sihwensis]|uniref:hypothetical protein n=1 Tax=Gordonia sihwensis TaxID=173559 RepID=UPI003D953119
MDNDEAYTRIGTAQRTTPEQARAHYAAGGTILVSDSGQDETPVTKITTTHSTKHGITSWDELAEQVETWSSRYPNQHYYLVTLD